MQCYARLVGAHKAAVTKLLVVGGKEPGSPDALVSAAADGTIAYWQPSMSAAGIYLTEPIYQSSLCEQQRLSLALQRDELNQICCRRS